jgi:hypothetical protein
MSSPATPVSGEGRLWGISFLVSLLVNAVLFGTLAKISSIDATRQAQALLEARPVERWVAAVIPERGTPSAPSVAVAAPRPPAARPAPFSRTSPEQASERPAAARFIGERNTRATSERAADATAPPLPSQNGVEDERLLETTENRFREGGGNEGNEASPAEIATSSVKETPSTASLSETKTSPAQEGAEPRPLSQEPLAQGPKPVDVETAAAKSKPEDSPKPMPQEPVETKPAPPPPVEPKPSEPVGSGDQKKTQIRGSISRQGGGALDVEDSPSGRYQAAVIREVEREWQRNCVKYKEHITPGFLTVRFVVESTGKVRSVDFVEAANSSDLQKGFTLNSIREAKLPAMPAGLKKERRGEPLELIYNFYFQL